MASIALPERHLPKSRGGSVRFSFPSLRPLAGRFIRAALHRSGFNLVRTRTDDLDDYHRLFPAASVKGRRFYNVGAGSFFHPLWTNLDYISDWYGEVQHGVIHYDLMADGPLPIDDGTAEIIYTSHTVEHVKDDAVARLFREAHRALKPGGVFRVTTGPDADTDFRALERGDESWFYWDAGYDGDFARYSNIFIEPPTRRPIEERWLHHVASQLAPNDRSPSTCKFTAEEIRQIIAEKGKIGALDYFTGLCEFQPDRPFNHVSWWNADKLIDLMREAGFQTVYRSGYGQSACPVLRNTHYFDNTHPQMSVYVEAIR